MVDLGVEWTVVYRFKLFSSSNFFKTSLTFCRTFAVALLTTFMVLHIKGENVEMEGGEDEEEEKEEEQFEWKEEENGKIDENNSNAADEAENNDLIMKEFFPTPTTMEPIPKEPFTLEALEEPITSVCMVCHQEFPGVVELNLHMSQEGKEEEEDKAISPRVTRSRTKAKPF